MTQLIGYGEDALTFRAVTERLPEVLSQLGDNSAPGAVLILFRPSFGRRSGSPGGNREASFGEFDAILASETAVYLVEAKWSRSGETYRQKQVILRSEQTRRHHVLKWYLRRWRQHNPASWDAFRSAVVADFETTFHSLTVPHDGQHLAANLEYILRLLSKRGENVVDVLLYIDVDQLPCPPLPSGSAFRCVNVVFTDAHPTGFFPMHVVPTNSSAPVSR